MPHVQPTKTPDLLSTLDYALRLLLGSIDTERLHPGILCDLERDLHALCAWAADTFFATFLSSILTGTDFERRVIAAKRASSSVRLHVHDKRKVTLTLLAGHLLTLEVRSLRVRGPKPGRPREHTRRGKGTGHQATPVLEVLGFVHRRSAACSFELLEAMTSLESVDKGRARLARDGIRLCKSSALKSLEVMGSLALQAHEAWLEDPSQGSPFDDFDLTGRRVVLGFDGGRSRERLDKRGRKKANGHRDFEAPWVEPRQLVIYTLDERGRLDSKMGKVTLASLDKPDTLFKRITNLFKALKLNGAAEVIVTADGQHWQWQRLDKALNKAGVEASRITQVLDLGHALGRLHELAHLPKSWPQGKRTRWYLANKALLKSGQVEPLQTACAALARGRRSKEAKSLAGYFQEHAERMRYAEYRARKIPCGSGVVESTIRQVMNHRTKGVGKFWKRANLERMLMLRSWWVTGRLEAMWRFALRGRVAWWHDAIGEDSCGVQACAA